MKKLEKYDKTNPLSIEKYGQELVGKTFRDVIELDKVSKAIEASEADIGHEAIDLNDKRTQENKDNKGNLGQIIEEKHFHYLCNNDSRPDFHEAGVELKVTPYKINPKGKKVAKERLILTMIDYFSVVNEEFEDSHLWNKSKLILLVYYLYLKEIQYRIDYKIDYVKLFTPPEQDIKIIKHDYEVIVRKIKEGKAHELSEGDTLYLGATTKAASSADRRKQPFSEELAKPRAFSFKSSYMTYVLNNYIIPGKNTYEPIIKQDIAQDFEEYVEEKIGAYQGCNVDNLCKEFQIVREKRPKNLEAMLAYRMLGIKGNHAEEFEKANIVVKTIRIGRNNKIKESMSFPTFKFTELVKENWETSTFGNYLEQTRFLFVIYKYNENDELVLKGCQFWNMPYEDLQIEVRSVWERTVKVIREGIQIIEKNGKRTNNLPNASDNRVCHVRPHGQNASDTYPLPDGKEYTKQCFWLNNSYILSQIDKKFLED